MIPLAETSLRIVNIRFEEPDDKNLVHTRCLDVSLRQCWDSTDDSREKHGDEKDIFGQYLLAQGWGAHCAEGAPTNFSWPFDPQSLPYSTSEGVVSHLWAPLLECVLRAEQNIEQASRGQGSTRFSIPFKGATLGQITVHNGFLPVEIPESPPENEPRMMYAETSACSWNLTQS